MKTLHHPRSHLYRPSESAIREKAHELYMQSGWVQGRDLDNWLEAEAWLTAHPPVDDDRAPVPPEEEMAGTEAFRGEDD